MNIAIIDYGAGNIQSIRFSVERLGFKAILTSDEDQIRNADKVIFPGVGEASSAMKKLRETGLDVLIPILRQPVLGICLGMQLMCNHSDEGNTKGLKIFDVDVVRFPSVAKGILSTGSKSLKVPQIQWNTIYDLRSALFQGIPNDSFIYMVHSFYAPISEQTVANCEYGIEYSAALAKGNFYGTQFHPEKSSDIGQQILKNFLAL